MVLEELAVLIAAHSDVSASEITAETSFESLGIDSLETVEMIMELEEKMGIELNVEQKLETVGDLLAFINSKVG